MSFIGKNYIVNILSNRNLWYNCMLMYYRFLMKSNLMEDFDIKFIEVFWLIFDCMELVNLVSM